MRYRSTLLAVTFFIIILCGSQAAQAPDIVHIGVQLPITGERASVGRLMVNGLQMAVAAINSRNEGRGPKLEITLADDESTPEGAVTAIAKLTGDPQTLAIVGEINSPFVMASVPIVNKEGLVYLTAGSSPRTTAASEWIFRVGASDALLAEFLARYIVDELHVKSLAILHDKTGIHNQRAALIASVLKEKYKIAPLAEAGWSPGDKDFTSQLALVKESHAEAVLALGETPEGGSFFRQMKSLGLGVDVITQRDFGVKRVLDEAAGAADGAYVITEYSPDLQGPATRAWNEAYRKQYGGDANVIAAQYYDSLMLLAEAVQAGGANRTGLKSGLEHLRTFPGVVADYTFDAERNGIHRFYVARVTNGKLVTSKILDQNSRP